MNPIKLLRILELERLVKLQAKLNNEGAATGYIDRKIADLQAKLQ